MNPSAPTVPREIPPLSDDPPGGDIREPPRSLGRALRQIGPGLILAGSIVGTGELIATTGLGAAHGYTPALVHPPELRHQGLPPDRARPLRDHPRQDDPGGLRHPARPPPGHVVDGLALAGHDARRPRPRSPRWRGSSARPAHMAFPGGSAWVAATGPAGSSPAGGRYLRGPPRALLGDLDRPGGDRPAALGRI